MKQLKPLLCLLVLAAVPCALTVGADMTPQEISKTVKEAMDPTANPCENFYQYACGGWIANT